MQLEQSVSEFELQVAQPVKQFVQTLIINIYIY